MIGKFAAWNVKGLNYTLKQSEVKSLIKDERISIKGCRLAVGWDPFIINVKLISQIDQAMHFEVVVIIDNKKCFISYIYVENTKKESRRLWKNLMDRLAIIGNSPWALLGDFNVSLSFEEFSNNFETRDRGIEDFRECVQSLEVEDINSYGVFFTWIEKRMNPELGILKKLDRVIGNGAFVHNFGRCYANFIPNIASDHYPALLVFPDVCSFKHKSFRLKNIKKYMKKLNKDMDPYDALLREEELIYSKAYHDAVVDKERLMKQKSKIEWLREEDVGLQLVDHFKNFLGAEEDVFPIQDCNGLFIKKLDPIISTSMIRHVLDEEIRDAMFGIKDDKVAALDGFTSKFFKKAWSIVRLDVCRAIREFFISGKLLGELNANLISLVPKLKIPIRLSDYRLIACCNVVYKCISKVLTNRLKEGLNGLVDINQCAFIPGRQISNIILLTQELMSGYDWKNKARKCDLRKSNNSIWSVIQRLVLGASVYFIWQERNVRLFENKCRTVDVVFNLIVNTFRLKLLSLNVKWSRDVGIAANIWGLPRLGLKGTYGLINYMDIDDSNL
nr:hypothetical protein [Tanacetum cinerariifolium]